MAIPPEGCSGFATTRFVRAASQEEAEREALRLVSAAAQAEPAFASSPGPDLRVHSVYQVSPLKRSRPNSGYTFVGQDSSIEDALDLEIKAGSGWLL